MNTFLAAIAMVLIYKKKLVCKGS